MALKPQQIVERALRTALRRPKLNAEFITAIGDMILESWLSRPPHILTDTKFYQERIAKWLCPACGRVHRNLQCTLTQKGYEKALKDIHTTLAGATTTLAVATLTNVDAPKPKPKPIVNNPKSSFNQPPEKKADKKAAQRALGALNNLRKLE